MQPLVCSHEEHSYDICSLRDVAPGEGQCCMTSSLSLSAESACNARSGSPFGAEYSPCPPRTAHRTFLFFEPYHVNKKAAISRSVCGCVEREEDSLKAEFFHQASVKRVLEVRANPRVHILGP